ncbi:pilus assembly FimT family protein [Hydrogenimonas sp.]
MKKAFTLLELIAVIVIVAILSLVLIPRFGDSKLREAADQIIAHIRYTQHLAMMDDRYNPEDPTWYYERWRINFRDCAGASTDKYYVVYRDLNHGGASAAPGRDESAVNPHDKKFLYNSGSCEKNMIDSSEVLIGLKYGITDVGFHGGCTRHYLAFDKLGRPYGGTYGTNSVDGLLMADCNITFDGRDGNFTVTVKKETGYVYLSDINP